jgi:predicted nucleic acid-binding protein
MIYLDASYIVKCYLRKIGTSAVMALVQGATACRSAAHARIEGWSAIHRRMRDKTISLPDARDVWRQFEQDETLGVWRWLSLTHIVIRRACDIFEKLPPDVFLRSGDAPHLACAAENRFIEVYSGDRILLAVAPHFGLNGISVY